MSEEQTAIDDFFENLRVIEKKWQLKWAEKDIFKGVVDKSKKKYFVTIPYPYSSGALHVGHARTYTLGDLFCRYNRQIGNNTLWPMAFHITGTPVLSVSAKIKKGDKNTIDMYSEYVGIYESDKTKINRIVKSFAKPMNVAMYFAGKMINDFNAMGYSIDTHRQFTTGDPEYNKFIEWQYKHLIEKNLIVKGEYPILWCQDDKNAVGEDDIRDADVDKVEVQEFVALKFSLGEDILIAGTFRPETIYGATNLWIHPDAEYKRIRINNETWIVSELAAEKLRQQNHQFEELEVKKGSDFIGLDAFAPRVLDRPLPVLPARFVDPNHATGVVYSVPAHAPYDYIALRDLQEESSPIDQYSGLAEKVKQLEPIALISLEDYGEFPAVEIVERLNIKNQHDHENLEIATQEIYSAEFYNGIMKDFTEEFAGQKVEQAKANVAQTLASENRAFSFYECSRKAECRCGGNIIVAVLPDQYFLNYGDKAWKAKATQALSEMTISPEKYRKSFERTFDWLDRRPCVRKRGLGTEFPLTKGQGWIIESLSDSVIYMAFYTIIPHINAHNISPEQLIPEVFDYIFLKKGKKNEIAIKSDIKPEILFDMQKEFEYWYPNDFRHTAIAHISNHLSFAIFHHVAIFPKKYWLKCFSLNELLIREGEKMSKSAGNVIPIALLPKKYSVDVTRLYLIAAGSADTVLNWTDDGVLTLVTRFRKLYSVINEIASYPVEKTSKINQYSFMTRAFLSACETHLDEAIKQLESLNGRDYVTHVFHQMLKEVEFYKKSAIGVPKKEKQAALRHIIDRWNLVLSPMIPHFSEEINEKLGSNEFCSLRLLPKLNITKKTDLLMKQTHYIMDLMEDIQSIIELKRDSPKKIIVYIAPEWKQELFTEISKILGGESFNIGKIMGKIKTYPLFASKMKVIAKELKSIRGNAKIFRKEFIGTKKELEAIQGYEKYIGVQFNCPIEVYVAESEKIRDPMNKASKAQPTKPAIFMEF
ncbi:MAG: leucine--tRNA ligase [Candidatus Hodarchaeales archaeon]